MLLSWPNSSGLFGGIVFVPILPDHLGGVAFMGRFPFTQARSQPPITPSVDDSAEKASPSSSASRKPREEKPAKAEAKGECCVARSSGLVPVSALQCSPGGDKNGRSSGDDKKEGRSSSHHRSPPSTTRRERDRGNDRGRRSFGQGSVQQAHKCTSQANLMHSPC